MNHNYFENNLLDILGRFSYRRGTKRDADPFCILSITDSVKERQYKISRRCPFGETKRRRRRRARPDGRSGCATVPEIGVSYHGLGHRSGLL